MDRESKMSEGEQATGLVIRKLCGASYHVGCRCEAIADIVGTLIGIGSKSAVTVCERVAGLRRQAIWVDVDAAVVRGQMSHLAAQRIKDILDRDDDSFLAGPKSV